MALPACDATMVQEPEVRNVAVVPATVQTAGVEEVNVTVKPEVDDADSASGVPTVCVAMAANVMLCDCTLLLTVKLCEIGVAAE